MNREQKIEAAAKAAHETPDVSGYIYKWDALHEHAKSIQREMANTTGDMFREVLWPSPSPSAKTPRGSGAGRRR